MKNNNQYQIYDRREWEDLPPQNQMAWHNFYMTHAEKEITDTTSYRNAQKHKKILVVTKAVKGDYTLQNDPLLEVIDGREWQNVPAEEQSAWTKLAQELKENLNNTQDYLNIQRLQRARQFIESFEDLNVSKQQEDEPNLIASNKANTEMAKNMAAIDNNSNAIAEEKWQALEAEGLRLAAKKQRIVEGYAAFQKKTNEENAAEDLKKKQRETEKLKAQKNEVPFNQNSQPIKTQYSYKPYNQNQEESKELDKTDKRHDVSNAYKYPPRAEKLEQEKNDALLALKMQQEYDWEQPQKSQNQDSEMHLLESAKMNLTIQELEDANLAEVLHYSQPKAQEESKKDLNKLSVDVNASTSDVSKLDYWQKLPQQERDSWHDKIEKAVGIKLAPIKNLEAAQYWLNVRKNILQKESEDSQYNIDKTQLTKVTSDYYYALKSQAVDNAYDLNQNIQSTTLAATQPPSSKYIKSTEPLLKPKPQSNVQNTSLQNSSMNDSIKLQYSNSTPYKQNIPTIAQLKEANIAFVKAYARPQEGLQNASVQSTPLYATQTANSPWIIPEASPEDLHQSYIDLHKAYARPQEGLQNFFMNDSIKLQDSSAQLYQQNIPQLIQSSGSIFDHMPNNQPIFDPTPPCASALHQNPPGQPIFDPIAPIDPQDNIEISGSILDLHQQ
jgi:hypothetical protein